MNYAEKIGKYLSKNQLKISTVESCTGGLLSSKLIDISGSSEYITLNLVTYSNDAKMQMLGVKKETLDKFGAVSEECAYEMASGLNKLTNSDICVSTTGIAGPTGGVDEKPVGLMYSTIYSKEKIKTYKINFPPQTPRVEMKNLFANEVLKNIYRFMVEL